MSAGARMTKPVADSFAAGRSAAFVATGGSTGGSTGASAVGSKSPAPAEPTSPLWAQNLRRTQQLHSAGQMGLHTLERADAPGAGATPQLKDDS
jgi:type IV secretory pathway TrbL component